MPGSNVILGTDLLKTMISSGHCWDTIEACGNLSDFCPPWVALMVGGEGYSYNLGVGYVLIASPDGMFRWVAPFDLSYEQYLEVLEKELSYYGSLTFVPEKAVRDMHCKATFVDKEFVLSTETLICPSHRRVREYIRSFDKKTSLVECNNGNRQAFIRCVERWTVSRGNDMPHYGLWDLGGLYHLIDNLHIYEDLYPIKLLGVEYQDVVIGVVVGAKLSRETWTVLYRKGLRGHNGIDEYLWKIMADQFSDLLYENDGGASGMMDLHRFKMKYIEPGGYLQNIYTVST